MIIHFPSSDVLWAAALAACVAVVAAALANIIASKLTAQRLCDHINECDKRQAWIMEKLESMDRKLDDAKKRWFR